MKNLKIILVVFVLLLTMQFATAGRYYNAATGRFLSVDKLADKYPSVSPYSYVFNNPLAYIDPDGNEPNKSQATNPRRLIRYLVSTRAAQAKKAGGAYTAGDFLAYLGDYETLGGDDPTHKRYIYTRKGGWIDLVHFFNVATEIDQLSAPKKMGAYIGGGFALWQETKNRENEQAAQGSIGTAWSYEDAPSNYLGYTFWKFNYDSGGDLIAQIIAFLKEYGATDPENAPNWTEMWTRENSKKQQFPQNKSFFPTFTSDDNWWSDYDPSKR